MTYGNANPGPFRLRLLDLPFDTRFAVYLKSSRVKRSVEQVHQSRRCVNPVALWEREQTEFAACADSTSQQCAPNDHDFTPLAMSSTSLAGVTGVCAMRTPKGCSASSMAEITAAAVGIVLTSPAPLAPSGLSGDGVCL